MDSRRSHPILSQVPLIISPSLQPPQAVTLPYNYHKPPSRLPVSNVPVETLEKIITDTSGFLDALDTKHTERQEAYAKWLGRVEESEVQERRRIAPGYLDTTEHILRPTRREEQKVEVPQPVEESELDKAFGRVSLATSAPENDNPEHNPDDLQ